MNRYSTRTICWCAAMVVAASTGLAALVIPQWSNAAQGQTAASETPVAQTLATVRQTALNVATEAGDSSPASMEELSCSLGEAARTVDPGSQGSTVVDPRTGQPWADSQVYLVTMRGHFVINRHIPRGQPAPTGTVLTTVIDASSNLVVGRSLGEAPPALSQLGKPITTLQG